MSSEVPSKGLKRLGFVAAYASTATSTADGLYRRVRGVVPSSLTPTLAKAESTVASYAAPVYSRASDAAGRVLELADGQVDYAINTADWATNTGKQTVSQGLSSVKQIHETNVKTFSETSKAYYEWIQQFSEWAKERLNPVKGGQAALDTLLAAIAKAKEASDPDVAAKLATDAWASFAALPLVSRLLDTADPVTRTAVSSFTKLHDSVVGLTLYKRAVDTGASTLRWAATTSPYKLGATYLYPIVQPVADPALSKIHNSKVVQDTLTYWKPSAVAAA